MLAVPSSRREERQAGYCRAFEVYCFVSGETTVISYHKRFQDRIGELVQLFEDGDLGETKAHLAALLGVVPRVHACMHAYKYRFVMLPDGLDSTQARQLTRDDYADFLASSVLFCGPQALQQYVTVEFPRIAQCGEGGTEDMLVDPAIVASLQPGDGLTVKDGRVYRREYFSFVSNASLVRLPVMRRIQALVRSIGIPSSQTLTSLFIFGAFFGVPAVLQWCGVLARSGTPQQEFLYWQLVLVIIMLSAPITWVMNTVWLLTLLPLVINGLFAFHPPARRIGLALVSVGLLTASVADHTAFRMLLPSALPGDISHAKYVPAEQLVAAGLIL